ncbi:hypothetical protein [Shewanella sp. WPAGA9]|uniref:hypothetical protein n=1 Tax=Shewanella sp. ENK2 TaxID=2775245 RepID=UPI0017870F98|nr:hypothetical protein [Shewanella sp. WPAGA9]
MQRVIILNKNLRVITQVLIFIAFTFVQSAGASFRGIKQIGIEVDNILIRQFVETQNGAEVFYILEAEKQFRTVALNEQFGIFLLQKTEMAKLNHYIKGQLYIAHQDYFFEKAFWFQGQLILKNVTAEMEQGTFKSNELRLDPTSRRLFAENIQFITPATFVRKLNWSISVDNKAFLPKLNQFK